MKIHLTAFFIIIFTMGSMAAYEGPQSKELGWPNFSFSWGDRYQFSSGANSSAANIQNTYSGSWEFPASGGEINRTTTDGSYTFTRGGNTLTSPTEIYLNHNVSGYIGGTVQNDSELSGLSTIVIAKPGVTLSGTQFAVVLFDFQGANSMGSYTFEGGTYRGNQREAGYLKNVGTMVFDSTSFIAGGSGAAAIDIKSASSTAFKNTRGRSDVLYQASDASSGGGHSGVAIGGGGQVSGGGSFLGGDAGGETSIAHNTSGQTASGQGGNGLYYTGTVTFSGTNGFNFVAGDAADATSGGDSSKTWAYGGHGVSIQSGNGILQDTTFKGGNAAAAEIYKVDYLLPGGETITNSASNGKAYAHGGSGFFLSGGTMTVSNSTASGGRGGSAYAEGNGSYADASGGNGINALTGTLTINGGHYNGGNAGNALSLEGEAYALGGDGIYMRAGDLIINDGTFIGGKGGTANGVKSTDGPGVRIVTGSLVLNGGTVTGPGGLQDIGIWAENSDLTITENSAETIVDGDIILLNGSAANASLLGGTINGDIYKDGAGTTTLSISTNASYSGSFIQSEGVVNVSLSNSEESRFFSDVLLDEGTLNFSGQKVITAENSSYVLGSDTATLNFGSGADLSKGTRISTGLGTVEAGADLSLGDDARIIIGYDGFAGQGLLDITGNLIASNSNSKVALSGTSATPEGQIQLVQSDGVILGGNTLEDIVDVDAGWLTKIESVQAINGIWAAYGYNSLTNSSLSDLDSGLLLLIDSVVSDTNQFTSSDFYALNSLGAEGTGQIRYNISQQPDVSEAAFQMSQQVNKQIAARGSEFRSMNGFASAKPSFNTPLGVAGPSTDAQKTMKGWMRVYGSMASRDADSNFTDYDANGFGTVIGIDKSYGRMLVGVAGGYGRTDIDGGDTYQADIDNYHGSIYATLGGESIFLDLAATYGMSDTEENNKSLSSSDFESDILSGYIGAGKKIEIGERFSITPEASMLASVYEQETFDRSTLGLAIDMDDYDTESYLGSLGVNLATQHQLDWLNQGLAFIPEVRLHWLHEFNADPDDFTYSVNGTPTASAVRPKEEDLLRVGLGMDLWNWKYQSTKFEVDYDGLFSDLYTEHIFSGKVSVQF